MSFPRQLVALALLLAVLLALGASARAAGPLPSLDLFAADGSQIQVAQLSVASGKWIFVYVRPHHRASEELLTRLSDQRYAGVPQRTVIVLAGVKADGLAAFRAKHRELAGALWYVDPVKMTGAALKLSSAPIILGVDDHDVRWTLNGLPHDVAWTRSLLTSWVRR
jgi:hypothetical protein